MLTQPLRRNAELFPDRIATTCGGRQNDWRTTLDRVARLAAGIRDSGAGRGDRVAILSLNSDRYIEALYATLWAGCVSVPLNTRWSLAELKFAVADSMPTLLFYSAEFADAAAQLGLDVVGVIPMDGRFRSGVARRSRVSHAASA